MYFICLSFNKSMVLSKACIMPANLQILVSERFRKIGLKQEKLYRTLIEGFSTLLLDYMITRGLHRAQYRIQKIKNHILPVFQYSVLSPSTVEYCCQFWQTERATTPQMFSIGFRSRDLAANGIASVFKAWNHSLQMCAV